MKHNTILRWRFYSALMSDKSNIDRVTKIDLTTKPPLKGMYL
jgi:hypothetical protein